MNITVRAAIEKATGLMREGKLAEADDWLVKARQSRQAGTAQEAEIERLREQIKNRIEATWEGNANIEELRERLPAWALEGIPK